MLVTPTQGGQQASRNYFHFSTTAAEVRATVPLKSSTLSKGFPMTQWVKNLPGMQETQETGVWSLGQEDRLEEMVTHFSILKNPMDRGAWRATVHWVAKSQR